MTLSDLASLGSFVSGLAVAITLVFLLLQARQNTQNLRSSVQQARANGVITQAVVRSEPFMSNAFVEAVFTDRALSADQIQAFIAYAVIVFWNCEDSFVQYRSGSIGDESFESQVAILRGFLAWPAFRTAWRINENFVTPQFQAFVDDLMRETRVQEPPDISEWWNSIIAEERAAIAG